MAQSSFKSNKTNKNDIKNYISKDTPLVHSSSKSKTGLYFPELIKRYTIKKPSTLVYRINRMPFLCNSLHQLKRSYKSIKKNPVDSKTKADEDFIESLKKYAKKLGCEQIGFAKVNPRYIFKDKYILFDNAIVLTMEMEKSKIDMDSREETTEEMFRVDIKLGKTARKLARLLRLNGFKAQANTPIDGDVDFNLLGEAAGLGAIGRHGRLISPECGPRQKIAAVYTNIDNLPFSKENKHSWIKTYCKSCNRCLKACPPDAIYDKPKKDKHGNLTYFDYRRCSIPLFNEGCTLCIKKCTFSYNDYESIFALMEHLTYNS